ncbi:MAG: PD-(D/E)XK nuclease family transposase [Suilimivivens sp.]
MTENACIFSNGQAIRQLPLPSFPSRKMAEAHFKIHSKVWTDYLSLPASMQQELIDFCMGKQGLKITYDTIFRRIFDPGKAQGIKRLESLLSAILEKTVKIIRVMPREGTQMRENASFVVMDVLVQLDDSSFANVEMQKIGYNFPLARADCYVSDIIMRQYVDTKASLGKNFSFNDLHKVYSIILMEQSPTGFHQAEGKYVHIRKPLFNTGIYPDSPGLHQDIFLCLDSFHSIVHNITKSSSNLEAWLTFLSATEPETISALIEAYPCFVPIYQEIADFVKKPEELIGMLSEELYIMDKNMERLMVSELKEEAEQAKAELENAKAEKAKIVAERDSVLAERDSVAAERDSVAAERDSVAAERDSAIARADSIETERNIFKLKCRNKTSESIAKELHLTTEYVNSVLAEAEI